MGGLIERCLVVEFTICKSINATLPRALTKMEEVSGDADDNEQSITVLTPANQTVRPTAANPHFGTGFVLNLILSFSVSWRGLNVVHLVIFKVVHGSDT